MSPRRRKAGRPPLADRSAVRSTVVTLKLAAPEYAMLLRLVEVHERELRARAHGARVEATVSSYIRDLIARDAEARELS